MLGALLQLAAEELVTSVDELRQAPAHIQVALLTPIQRNINFVIGIAAEIGFTALGLADPTSSLVKHGCLRQGPLPMADLWPQARGLSRAEADAWNAPLGPRWREEPSTPWEDPVPRCRWGTCSRDVLSTLTRV